MDVRLYTVSIKGVFNKRYEVYRDEEMILTAKSVSLFSFGDMLVVDRNGVEVARLNNKLYGLNYKYNIQMESRANQLPLRKKIMSNHYIVNADDATIEVIGNFMSTEYTFYRNGVELAKVSRKLWRTKKAYGIAIIGDQDDILFLNILMCIIKIRRLRKNN